MAVRRETIQVLNRDGDVISDPTGSIASFRGLRWRTGLDGGFMDCEFYVPLDMLRVWAVKEAYSIRVYDGLRSCYWGRIEDLTRSVNLPGRLSNALRKVTAFGFWVNCCQRMYSGSHVTDDGDSIIIDALGECPLVSSDVDEIGNMGLSLGVISWEDTYVSDVIKDVLDYGDNATPPETWHFAIWDGERTSDGLAKAWLFQRDVSDYDLQIPLSAISGQVSVTSTLAKTVNYVVAKTDDEYTDPAQDAGSQSDYDRRDYLFMVRGATVKAENVRDRYLERHKDPETQMSSIKLSDDPLTKAGAKYEMNRVRAGQRVVFPELRRAWDKVYYIIATDYDADNHTLSLTFDEEPEVVVPREIVAPPPETKPYEPFYPGPPVPWHYPPPRWPEGPRWV